MLQMVYIIYRKRNLKQVNFFEYFVVEEKEVNVLSLPLKIPEKYKNRILGFSIFFSKEKQEEIHCIEVKSITHNEIIKFDKNSCLKNGCWIIANDCIGKGEFIPENIKNVVQYMNIELKQCEIIIEFDSFIMNQNFTNNHFLKVISVYHGTSEESFQSIQKLNYFKESYGMLGDGVYCGTIWKSSRFACFTQNYEKRKGIIIRCIAICINDIYEYPNSVWVCPCCNSSVSDHFSNWKKMLFDGAHAKQCTFSNGTCRDGKPKYKLKNEEWIIKSSCLYPTSHAYISIKEHHYNPTNRNLVLY